MELARLTMSRRNHAEQLCSVRGEARIRATVAGSPRRSITDCTRRAAEVSLIVIERPCRIGAVRILKQRFRAIGRRRATPDIILMGTRASAWAAGAERGDGNAAVNLAREASTVSTDGES